VATTSSGHAATLGRLDGEVTRDEALAHAQEIVAATSLPVSADLESGFDDPAETVRLAVDTGLAGCSIEDASQDGGVFDAGEAAERVVAAVQAAAGRIVLTARSENYLHDRADLADTIARLQRYQEAGADVLYAPGIRDIGEIRSLVESVDRPVNVLALPGAPPVRELAEAGVARVSVGGAFAFAALGAAAQAARELMDDGTYGFWELAGPGSKGARAAFRPS
jgi:2-methylisocitrate lyase-like PEP mutase family enzyme